MLSPNICVSYFQYILEMSWNNGGTCRSSCAPLCRNRRGGGLVCQAARCTEIRGSLKPVLKQKTKKKNRGVPPRLTQKGGVGGARLYLQCENRREHVQGPARTTLFTTGDCTCLSFTWACAPTTGRDTPRTLFSQISQIPFQCIHRLFGSWRFSFLNLLTLRQLLYRT